MGYSSTICTAKNYIKKKSNSTSFALIPVVQFVLWFIYFIQEKIEIRHETCSFLIILPLVWTAAGAFVFIFSLAQKKNKTSLYLHWLLSSIVIGAATFLLLFPPIYGFSNFFSHLSFIQGLHCSIKFPMFIIILILLPILSVACAEMILGPEEITPELSAQKALVSAHNTRKPYAEKTVEKTVIKKNDSVYSPNSQATKSTRKKSVHRVQTNSTVRPASAQQGKRVATKAYPAQSQKRKKKKK